MTYPKIFEYLGKQYTLKQLAEISGLSQACIRSRILGGWDIDTIMTTSARSAVTRYEYKGKFYTVAELAKLNGTLTVSGVRYRLSHGESIEQIISKPVQDKLTNLQKKYTPLKKPGTDVTQCKTCKCRGSLGNSKGSGVFCAYSLIPGNTCRMLISPPSPNCTVYVRGKSVYRQTVLQKIKRGELM